MKDPQHTNHPASQRHPGLGVPSAANDFLRGDPFLESDWVASIGPVFSPSFDLFETPETYTLLGDLPGLAMGDLDIELSADTLTITGEREGETPDNGRFCHALERTFGCFFRSFAFSAGVAGGRYLAKMENGVLRVDVPKRKPDPAPGDGAWWDPAALGPAGERSGLDH